MESRCVSVRNGSLFAGGCHAGRSVWEVNLFSKKKKQWGKNQNQKIITVTTTSEHFSLFVKKGFFITHYAHNHSSCGHWLILALNSIKTTFIKKIHPSILVTLLFLSSEVTGVSSSLSLPSWNSDLLEYSRAWISVRMGWPHYGMVLIVVGLNVWFNVIFKNEYQVCSMWPSLQSFNTFKFHNAITFI